MAINFHGFQVYKPHCACAGIYQLFETICYRNLHYFSTTHASCLIQHQLALKKKKKKSLPLDLSTLFDF